MNLSRKDYPDSLTLRALRSTSPRRPERHGHDRTRRHGKPPNIRTLLVDDSPRMLKVLSQIFSTEARFTIVGSATNGRQALRYASDLAPELVVIGSHLSSMSGIQAASQIKRLLKPPVIFMLKSYHGPDAGAVSQTAGPDVFVPRSLDLEPGLRARLREWFH